jgi:hypothetical protein
MQRATVVIALALTVTLACTTAGAQTRGPNLLERARTNGDIELFGRACGYFGGPPTLNGFIQNADVVFHGMVVAADGRVSDDLYEVWTDYRVEPFEVLRQHPLAESGVPPLTVRGGVVLVEGRKITYDYRQTGQRLSMTVGQEVVVLGVLRDKGTRFHVTAVFHVVAGRATSEGKLDGFEAAGVPLEPFLESIREVEAAPTKRLAEKQATKKR